MTKSRRPKMIVKIQASQYTTHETQQMFIYNKDKSVQYQEPLTETIKEALADRSKAYFIVEIIDTNKLIILKEVPTQDW